MTDLARSAETLEQSLAGEVAALRRAGLLRTLRETGDRRGVRVTSDGRPVVDFSSNDYLGLASDSRVVAAARDAAATDGAGAAASRCLGGNHPAYAALEADAAALKGTAAALLFSSGYAANVGALPALAGPDDVVYSDALNHASIIDGCRLARARVRVFPHADPATLAGWLRADAGRYRRRWIVVEGVYSMDGDLAPLPELAGLARSFEAGLYLDDAHATGVLGSSGGGSVEHWGLPTPAAVTVGTLGKAFGTAGAFVAGSRDLREVLVNRARSFVFSTGPSPGSARAAAAAIRIARSEPWRRERLRANAALLRDGLAGIGRPLPDQLPGHIAPVAVGDSERAVRLGARLRERGFLVGAIRPPTVAPGTARLRVTVSAAHRPEDVTGLITALDQALGAIR